MFMPAVDLVAAVTTPASSIEIRDIPTNISWVQIRSDLIGDIPADWLRSHFPRRLLYTLRTHLSGGRFDRSNEERQRRLIAAASGYDLVELEAETDLCSELLAAIPPDKRMIVWRGPADSVGRLESQFQRLLQFPARYYCIILSTTRTSDGLQPLSLLKSLRRADVVAFCDGPSGLWSQLLSPNFGAPLLFGQLHDAARKKGELSTQQLIADYGFPSIRPLERLYGMVGTRIFQSPSPRLHNFAYRTLDYPALFLPFHSENFETFWSDMVRSGALDDLGIPIQGLVIVSPHKEAAVAVTDFRSSKVSNAGSSNVLARSNGRWKAETTDPESIAAIRHLCPVKAAVIGCGGAGRAIAAALQQTGSEVTLVNRGLQRGKYAMQLLGLPFVPLSEFRATGFDVIVNATPVGKDNDGFPFIIDSLGDQTLIIDLAYGSQPTPLVSAVLARGAQAIDGHDVLLVQVRKQFHLMTGLEMPAGISREMILGSRDFASRTAFQVAHGSTEAYEYSA
ncbi:MAG TPA: type I 3-dehydroquinate dehydratase [Candidatus Sulfotelmatobacter sp.]|nr:type I 3-dehydroquinate dehydratase [Candidatus Sulfotelmatobacter sp.]